MFACIDVQDSGTKSRNTSIYLFEYYILECEFIYLSIHILSH